MCGRLPPLDPQGLHMSRLSLMQLSPNQVRSDFDVDTVDLFNVFEVSPVSDGVLQLLSPISSPESPSSQASPAVGSLPVEAAETRDSAITSPATSLSITDHTENLQLLTPPLIPLPDKIFVQTDSAVLMELIQVYQDFPVVEPHRVCHGRGRFDASTEPAATRDRPLISTRRVGCPYRTSYRDDDHSSVDSPFGVHVHQPRFIEWVGALESARLFSRPPADWLQVMNRRDTLYSALQLQRDASLMPSNLTLLHQYAIVLHRPSSEVLH